MFDRIETLRMADALMSHSARRQKLVAANVANADTPAFRAKDLASFETTFDASPPTGLRTTHQRHLPASGWGMAGQRLIDAGGEPNPNGNTVSLEEEMFRTADTRREFDLALAITRSSLSLLRTSLGRRA